MKHVVITGGTRGIGRAMALEFLKQGWRVSIAGRDPDIAQQAAAALSKESGSESCHGFGCNVRQLGEVEMLWKHARIIQPVDIWINNAGINHPTDLFHTLDTALIQQILETNLTGTVWGSRVALSGMKEQGSGALYNMEGFGSDGRVMNGMSIYGTSKRAVRYLNRSLIREYQDSPLLIGSISPGMLVTDMLLGPIRTEPEKYMRALKVFHTLCDPPDRVAPWIVSRIIHNRKHGRRIAWLTNGRVMWRFFSGMFRKRKVEGLPEDHS
jgi:NAD(P)-dependent dehydrogenase (short-subunit alcohol dehydrogenase family)